METYSFYEGSLAGGFALDFEPAIFNSPEFFGRNGTTGWLSYHVLNNRTQRAVCSIHFHVEGSIARSPYKAPFGSVECHEGISPGLLYDFLNYVDVQLKDKGVKDVYVKNPPRSYAPAILSLLECFLVNLGYVAADAECGATIAIDDTPFAARIAHSELLRNRQAWNAGLSCRMIPEDNVGEVYAFISTRHGEKGYKISISAEDLKETVRRFPRRYLLFGIFDGSKMVGASVSIRVKQNVLYNFLMNHDMQYNRLSPPVLLLENLYNYCLDNKISILDLGTSALGGSPNFSLLDFKLHLGGVPTTKFSFHKRIA